MAGVEWQLRGDRPLDVAARLRAIGEELREEIKAAVHEASSEGARVARSRVPHGEEDKNEITIRDSIRVTDTAYRPGGAGGGGFYESRLIAGEGAPHTEFVFEGTGMFGEHASPIRSPHGNRMAWDSMGRHWVRWQTKGQEPQTQWWLEARETLLFVLARASEEIRIA